MKKIMICMLASAVLLSCTNKTKVVDPVGDVSLTSVKVASVASTEVSDSLQVTGLLTTENEARLSFKIPGVIDKILVNEGAFVKKGQLLATLKVTEINSQFDQANLALEKAKRDFARASNLYKDSVTTLEQMQNAKTALDIAKKSVDAVQFNQQYSAIKAAADGFVTTKITNEGEVVAAGTPILIVAETSGNKGFVLRVGVTDHEWAAISIGQKAPVQLDAYGEKSFTGTVYRKSRIADQASGSFQIDVAVNFGSEKPAVGMFGKATLFPGKAVTELTIPYEALIQVNGNKASVFVPSNNNSLKKVAVTIGSFNEKIVIVQSGLREGDQVVISNNAFLNEQSKIAIAK